MHVPYKGYGKWVIGHGTGMSNHFSADCPAGAKKKLTRLTDS
jgi:hypothetical protein